MRYIETIHAQGHVLCHDITVIVKDVKKGVAFKKGHVVTEEDIPEAAQAGQGSSLRVGEGRHLLPRG